MSLRPYDVSQPFLMGDADPAIMSFAREKLAAMAKRGISRMQRAEASGIFEGEAVGLRSLWDEWCWYQANHGSNTVLLSDAAEQMLDEFIASVVVELPKTEAVLLTKAVAGDEDHGEGYDPLMVTCVVREIICQAASRRDMSRFEVY